MPSCSPRCFLWAGWLTDGVEPRHPWEPPEVSIRGAQLGAVLDGKGSEVSIARQVARRAQGNEEIPHHFEVPFSRVDHGSARLG